MIRPPSATVHSIHRTNHPLHFIARQKRFLFVLQQNYKILFWTVLRRKEPTPHRASSGAEARPTELAATGFESCIWRDENILSLIKTLTTCTRQIYTFIPACLLSFSKFNNFKNSKSQFNRPISNSRPLINCKRAINVRRCVLSIRAHWRVVARQRRCLIWRRTRSFRQNWRRRRRGASWRRFKHLLCTPPFYSLCHWERPFRFT